MRLSFLTVLAASTLTLSACVSSAGLRPRGEPTDPQALHAARSLPAASPAATAWPAADWWKGLRDAELDALIAEALKDNPGLAEADARARAAQALVGAAQAARGPSVRGGASVSGARVPETVLPMGGHFAVAKYGYASFKWGLDLWGGKRAAWQAAVGASAAADVAAHAARIELSANVARAYARLGAAFTQVDLAQEEHQRAEDARKLTLQRVEAGIDNRIQLEQGNAEVATAEQGLAQAQRMVVAARSALSVLLGKGPDRGLDIARPRPLALTHIDVPADLPVGLLAHRADLIAARWRIEAARKDIKVAKTEFLPDLSLGAMAGVVASGGANVLELPARFYQLGPSLGLPIFDGGRLRANLAGRDAAFDVAVAQYNQALVAAVDQVADQYSALTSLGVEIAAQERARAAADTAWELASQRYRAGIGSFLEALSVRQQLLAAEQGVAALSAQRIDVALELIEALGGGYQPGTPPPVLPTTHP